MTDNAPFESRIVWPGPRPGMVRIPGGELVQPPSGWEFLAAGDATLTRRVKAAGPSWTVETKIGKRISSLGIWAPTATVIAQKLALEAERKTPEYEKQLQASRARRERVQEKYVDEFDEAVVTFLNFHPRYADLARIFARAVTEHATPVGSGTVARTARIPVHERARAAVVAWMRHQTTRYDDMQIARVKGLRREVRRDLARESMQLLVVYRQGRDIDPDACPLQAALRPETTP